MKHLSELLMPEDVRPVASHLLYGETATRTERASQGINRSFSLTGHTNGVALVGPALLELTYPLALELVLHSAIVTDFTMERLLTPFSWERERRAKIINVEGEFQAARKNS